MDENVVVAQKKRNEREFPLTHFSFPWGLPTRAQPHNNTAQRKKQSENKKKKKGEHIFACRGRKRIFPSFSASSSYLIFFSFFGKKSNKQKHRKQNQNPLALSLPCVEHTMWNEGKIYIREWFVWKLFILLSFRWKKKLTDIQCIHVFMHKKNVNPDVEWSVKWSLGNVYGFVGWETNELVEEDMAWYRNRFVVNKWNNVKTCRHVNYCVCWGKRQGWMDGWIDGLVIVKRALLEVHME